MFIPDVTDERSSVVRDEEEQNDKVCVREMSGDKIDEQFLETEIFVLNSSIYCEPILQNRSEMMNFWSSAAELTTS